MADRDLTLSSEYSLSVCSFALQHFQQINGRSDLMNKFLKEKCYSEIFVEVVSHFVTNDPEMGHSILLSMTCSRSHILFFRLW